MSDLLGTQPRLTIAPADFNNSSQIPAREVPPPHYIASNPTASGYISYTANSLPGHLISPSKSDSIIKTAFAACPKPSFLQGWGSALGMFSNWLFGTGPSYRSFTNCDPQVQNLANATGVNDARDFIYTKNAGKPFQEWEPVTNYRASFGLSGLWNAGSDPTEQFVGSYSVDISPTLNNTLRFELNNTTSMTSFLYGLGPAYERSELSFGGNMRQTYSWEEPLK